MPNITKKRRRGDISAAEPNVSSLSLSSATAQDSIDSLLAEMAGTPAAGSVMNPLPSQVTGPSPMESQEELADRELCDPTLASRPLTSTQRARIATWNRSMLSWQKSPSGSYTTGLLPSFDVEMARHFKVQALSAYLLDACKELKMPAFERW